MLKICLFIGITLLALSFSQVVFSQCPQVMVAPYSSVITRGVVSNVQIEPYFFLERNKTALNYLNFMRNGEIRFKGNNFNPSALVIINAQKLSIYEYEDGVLLAFPVIPSDKVTSFLVLNTKNCRSRSIRVRPLKIDKVVWNTEQTYITTLCDKFNKNQFTRINTLSGKVTYGIKTSENNPCSYFEPLAPNQIRQSKTLNGSISEMLKLLEAEQYRPLLDRYFAQHNKVITDPIDETKMRDFAKDFATRLMRVLQIIKNVTPKFNEARNFAIFNFPTPVDGRDKIKFIQIKDFWYICDPCSESNL